MNRDDFFKLFCPRKDERKKVYWSILGFYRQYDHILGNSLLKWIIISLTSFSVKSSVITEFVNCIGPESLSGILEASVGPFSEKKSIIEGLSLQLKLTKCLYVFC